MNLFFFFHVECEPIWQFLFFFFLLIVFSFNSWLYCAVGKLPASQANPEVVSTYRKYEKEETLKLLQTYSSFCSEAKVWCFIFHYNYLIKEVVCLPPDILSNMFAREQSSYIGCFHCIISVVSFE